MELLHVENLTFTYPDAVQPAVDGVSFSLAEGEFAVLAGETGSGKSTLLRLLKEELVPMGERGGTVRWAGLPPAAGDVGFVMQDPERQIVTDKVWHELAFGGENLGLAPEEIARRVAETAAYFGLEPLYERDTATLSGGQKQLLCLAAVTVLRPRLLILDEPTAQLDPIAAAEFLSAVLRLNRDFGIAVLLSEHRLEEVLPAADRLIVMRRGRIAADGDPRTAAAAVGADSPLYHAMPAAVRIHRAVGGGAPCPLTVREGRRFIADAAPAHPRPLPPQREPEGAPILRFSDVYFRYGRDLPDVLRGVSLTVRQGEIFCLLGGNGAGKSTLLKAAAGLHLPYTGSVEAMGRRIRRRGEPWLYDRGVAYLPQDVQTAFLADSVEEELADAYGSPLPALPFDLSPLFGRHPYDLSGGEQQLLALCKVLAAKPRILLLDEPTKGLDAEKKRRLAGLLTELRAKGIAVFAVTHDVEFAASVSDRCGLFFHGTVMAVGTPRAFFAENRYYTTAVSRMTRGILPAAVTAEEAVRILLGDGVC